MPSAEPARGLPRWAELTIALPLALASLPLIALLALLVRLTSGGPAFFRQTRIGLHGEPFAIVKLRTMSAAPPSQVRSRPSAPSVTASGDARVTALGRVLRATKLDELPQLWNVLRGEMALVGPRPEVPRFVDLADPAWHRVLGVRPGITDPTSLALRDEEAVLAELGGDPDTTYRERLLPRKLASQWAYIEHRSAASDLAVLARTAAAAVGLARLRRDELS